MGLDTTHDAWHGAYSAFSRWRDKLAEVAGYTAHENERKQVIWDIDWGCIERVIGADLGEIQADFCAPLADRLEELLPLLGEEDGGGHIGAYRDKTERFIRGLRTAAEAGEPVGFH